MTLWLASAAVMLLALAACSGGADGPPADAPSYATQTDPPVPDYSTLIMDRADYPAPAEIERKAITPPPANAKALGELWLERLRERNGLEGISYSGNGQDGPVQYIATTLTAREFDQWVAANGWTAPTHIEFRFQDELHRPAVSESAKSRIRIWPTIMVRTGMQHMAALYGKVYVKDGCFRVKGRDGSDKLALFLAETGLDVDGEGFLILINRFTGETMARVGEEMVWAGPNGSPDAETAARIHEACGPGAITEVGNPESEERFYTLTPHARPTPLPESVGL